MCFRLGGNATGRNVYTAQPASRPLYLPLQHPSHHAGRADHHRRLPVALAALRFVARISQTAREIRFTNDASPWLREGIFGLARQPFAPVGCAVSTEIDARYETRRCRSRTFAPRWRDSESPGLAHPRPSRLSAHRRRILVRPTRRQFPVGTSQQHWCGNAPRHERTNHGRRTP